MQLPHSNSRESNDKNGSQNNVSGNEFQSSSSNNVPSNEESEFSEFMWMAIEDLEDFDRKVISEIDEQFGLDSGVTLREEEEEFLQRMLEEEEERDTVYFAPKQEIRNNDSIQELSNRMQGMGMSEEIAAQSTLNPHAAEFVPGQSFQNLETVEAPLNAVHHQSIANSVPGPLYSHNSVAPPHPPHLHAAAVSNVSANSHSPNILLNSSNSHHLNNHRFSNPVPPQLNGHSAMRRYHVPGVSLPVYMSNMPPMFPVMNGAPYAQLPPGRYQHPDGDRCNEDEGYGDN